jgi:pSer/pThr/pTyr-binding forkhead associated (FHA) protein
MQLSPHAFLFVVKGEPYSNGDVLPLVGDKTLLGRSSEQYEPDLPFDCPYVSRQHATIEYSEGAHLLTDLDSRHGTSFNGRRLTPGEAYDLEDRDRIVLARDEVVLTFSVAHPTGSETWDYAESQSESPASEKPGPTVILDQQRREVIIDGHVLVLRGRLWNLICLLYEDRRRVVCTVEIKREVWPERESGADGMPLVTNEEVATLIYRLRNRLAPYADLVRTFPGDGYMLDVE